MSNDVHALSCLNAEAFDEGYDLDGQRRPFFDAVTEEADFEYYVGETVVEGIVAVVPAIADVYQVEAYTPLSEIAINATRVKTLKEELKKCKQAVGRRKEELVL